MSTESNAPQNPRTKNSAGRLTIAGDFLDRVSSINSVGSSLLLSVASHKADRSRLLVPFVALDIKGSEFLDLEDRESTTFISEIISLDDLAYLTSSLSQELERAVKEFSEIVQGSSFHDGKRLGLLTQRLKRASEHIKGSLELVDTLKSGGDGSDR